MARSNARGIAVQVGEVRFGHRSIPPADLYLIGGGQDREQVTVASELSRLGAELSGRLEAGASLLAVCGGYQNLGRSIRTRESTIAGPGILPVVTDATGDAPRFVGPITVRSPTWIAFAGASSAARAGMPGASRTVVGFENHGGRTYLDATAEPFAWVDVGFGNNGEDGWEGVVVRHSGGGLLIGTYLHGPMLPRNPHVADALIDAALRHAKVDVALEPLDDRLEWEAHETYLRRLRTQEHARRRIPRWARRYVDPVRGLIGF